MNLRLISYTFDLERKTMIDPEELARRGRECTLELRGELIDMLRRE